MKITYLYPALIAVLLVSSCGPRIDGSSEKASKASYEKMKVGLSDEEQSKLDLAILYITGSAMADKWEESKKYKGVSLNDIVIKKIDGKTKGGILDLGEECLKKEKEREIKNAQDGLEELKKTSGKKRIEYAALKKKLSALQGRFLKMVLEGGEPVVYCVFKNVTPDKDFDMYAITLLVNSIPKKSVISSRTASYSGVGTLSPRDTLVEKIVLDAYYRNNAPEIPWKDIKYPVTNPAQYGLDINPYTTDLNIDDKDYSLSTLNWSEQDNRDYEENLKTLNAKLKEAQKKPDNLYDELKHGSK